MQQICTKYNFPYTIRFINTKLCSYGCDSIRFINYNWLNCVLIYLSVFVFVFSKVLYVF